MTRGEYREAMRGVSKLAVRTTIEAARKTRLAVFEAMKPLIAEITAGRRPAGINKTKLAEDIYNVIKTEGMKPVEKLREVRSAIEAGIAERLGIAPTPPPSPPSLPVLNLENARRQYNKKAEKETPYQAAARTFGRAFTAKAAAAYKRDPKTGKITWDDAALTAAFRKSYDLSKAVWNSVEEIDERIFDVINCGTALHRDPVDIAKDLETYIRYDDGGKRVAGRWGAMFPDTDKGRLEAWKREYLQFHDLQPGSEEARAMLKTPEAKDWLAKMMREKTQLGTPLLPDAVKQYIKRIGKAGLDYRAIREVRTQNAAMVADEETDFAKNSYAATGQVDWVLKSHREKWGCQCADFAAGGPYNIDELPATIPVHPNCDCEIRPRLKSDDELRRAFKILAGID